MNPHATRRAYTILEMLLYIAIVSIVITVAFLSYYRCWDHTRDLMRQTSDVVRAMEAGERWRDDVRAATARPTLDGGVLCIPQRGGEVRYRLAGQTVQRRLGGGAWMPALGGVAASRMVLDEGKHVRSWRWEVEVKAKKREVRVRPRFTFRAVAAEVGR
mgnify:CR=1 FL=1